MGAGAIIPTSNIITATNIKKRHHDEHINNDDCNKKPKRVSNHYQKMKDEGEKNFRQKAAQQKITVNGPYNGYKEWVNCHCERGHHFKVKPKNSRKLLCLECVREEQRKPNQEDFQRIMQSKGARMVGKYENRKKGVKCICINGHTCWPTYDNIKQGQGICRKCAGLDKETSKENFYKNIATLRGTVTGEYVDSETPVACRCSLGHPCNPAPKSIQQGHGMCKRCANRDPKVLEKKFHDKLKEFNAKAVGNYVNAYTQIKCVCSKGDTFYITPTSLIWGNVIPCRKCNPKPSKGNAFLMKSFKHLKFDCEDEDRLDNPPSTWLRPRPYDFINKKLQEYWEYDGHGHFQSIPHWGGEKTFKKNRKTDIEKTIVPLLRGYKIIRIHFLFLKEKETDKIQFLKNARESKAQLVLYNSPTYDWLLKAIADYSTIHNTPLPSVECFEPKVVIKKRNVKTTTTTTTTTITTTTSAATDPNEDDEEEFDEEDYNSCDDEEEDEKKDEKKEKKNERKEQKDENEEEETDHRSFMDICLNRTATATTTTTKYFSLFYNQKQ